MYNKFSLNQMFYENVSRAFVALVSLISVGILMFIVLSVTMIKKIRDSHPSKVIAFISLAELFSTWSMMVW